MSSPTATASQPSLLEPEPADPFDDPSVPRLLRLADGLTRHHLDDTSWIDVRRGWLASPDPLLIALRRDVVWHAERRQMYDRVVDVPRLVAFHADGIPLPHPVLVEARTELSRHYLPELGEPFATAGLCWYRDGRDSVAWHGDLIGRSRSIDTMVAILSVGSERTLLLRPREGGPSRRVPMGSGDLVVMGGRCQRDWEHAVPKTSREVGDRISIQYRVRGVR